MADSLSMRRKALQHPAVRRARAGRELVRLVRALAQSTHFDQLLYEEQRGRAFRSRSAAAWDFVVAGSREGLVAGPLLVPPQIASVDRPAGRLPAAWWASQIRTTGFPDATAVPLPANLSLNASDDDLAPFIASGIAAVRRHTVNASPAAESGRTDVSLVVLLGSDVSRVADLLTVVGDETSGVDEIVIVPPPKPPPDARVVLGAAALVSPRIRVVDDPSSVVGALAIGMAQARGDRVIVVTASLTMDVDSVRELHQGLGSPGVVIVAPVILEPDDTVFAAGRALDGRNVLRGQPWADALRAGDVAVEAVPSVVFALDRRGIDGPTEGAPPWTNVSDLDAVVTALCRSRSAGEVRVVSKSTASLAAAAGIVAPGTSGELSPSRATRVHKAAPGDVSGGGLRWAIKSPHPAGARRHTWGDYHFAHGVASALELQGHEVAVDPLDSWYRPSGDHDDVVLVLRGLHRYEPAAHQTTVLWVISHPDLVAGEELAQADLAFAASRPWAAARRAEGHRVEALLQCTNATLFSPDPEEPDTGPSLLFVGNRRGAHRPILEAAFDAGFKPTVIGQGWSGRIPASCIRAEHVANAELSALYRSAGVVLNDHWPEMAREGFLSNRLFDLTASAARWVSDPAADLLEIFPLARVATDADSLAPLLRAAPDSFATESERLEAAEWVRTEHSFEARARTLIAAVSRVREARR